MRQVKVTEKAIPMTVQLNPMTLIPVRQKEKILRTTKCLNAKTKISIHSRLTQRRKVRIET